MKGLVPWEDDKGWVRYWVEIAPESSFYRNDSTGIRLRRGVRGFSWSGNLAWSTRCNYTLGVL